MLREKYLYAQILCSSVFFIMPAQSHLFYWDGTVLSESVTFQYASLKFILELKQTTFQL